MARAIPPSTVAEQLLEVNGAFSIGPPKSAAGRRTVTLPAVVVEALAEHLRRYTAESPEAVVFLSRRRLAARGDEPADGEWSAGAQGHGLVVPAT
jgi:hypothetical protein